MSSRALGASSLITLLLLAACAVPQTGRAPEGGERGRLAGPTRIVAAVMSEPIILFNSLAGPIPGVGDVEDLLGAELTIIDDQSRVQPQLAEAVPSVENGLWKVLPDGTMETTWRLRRGTEWHDGVPLTSSDLLFSAKVRLDREIPEIAGGTTWTLVDTVEPLDERTVVVKWRAPYIDADQFGYLMPRHLLEQPYTTDKPNFAQLPYWSTDHVGAGPYRLREWVRGSHLVVEANDRFVLGRPRIDEIEVRFIPDANTLMANVLAGAVELTLGRNVSFEQAVQVREQWKDGRVKIAPASALLIYPQFLYTQPLVVREAQFRRALTHAMNRQELVDSLLDGLTSVAHSLLGPKDPPEYQVLDQRVVKYPYDPTRAVQFIQSLGYTRGTDGFFRDLSGQRLTVEMRTTGDNQIHLKTIYPVVDYWQRAGVEVQPVVIPPQRQREREYRSTFPAFELLRSGNLRGVANYHSSKQKTPENNWTGSYTGYGTPELDGMVDRYVATIPLSERVRVLGDVLHHMTDQVVVFTLFWDVEPVLIGNRILGPTGRADRSTHAWNAHLWEVKS